MNRSVSLKSAVSRHGRLPLCAQPRGGGVGGGLVLSWPPDLGKARRVVPGQDLLLLGISHGMDLILGYVPLSGTRP